MLEASRAEINEHVPEFLENKSLLKRIYLFIDGWIIEPVATGFRFLHLVFIFVPVIVTIPVIFLGARKKERDNERSGSLWWYGFLVKSMERAGAAFIKVRMDDLQRHFTDTGPVSSSVNGLHLDRTSSLKRCAP